MSFKEKLQNILSRDWFIALFLLGVFLATNGYIYVWDDQHLEIPLLKSLIDPTLYPGDYYVQSLRNYFPSYFYRLLAFVIKIDQIPAVYLTLYLLSRYFLFFWAYKLWREISKQKFAAAIAVTVFILSGRVEEFLYRTFSHQEFALAIIFFGLYLFYRRRFVWAAAIFGLTANIHAVYSVFPMFYLAGYLLWDVKEHGWKEFFKSSLAFLVTALPVIILIIRKYTHNPTPADSGIFDNWMSLYWITCPQNFVFQDISLQQMAGNLKFFIKATERFFILIILYALNGLFYEDFRRDKKVQTIALITVILLAVSYVFTYIRPSRFIIDLNLVRNIQYLRFFLIGYATILFVGVIKEKKAVIAVWAAVLFSLLRFADVTTVAAMGLALPLFALDAWMKRGRRLIPLVKITGYIILFLLSVALVTYIYKSPRYGASAKLTLSITLGLLFIIFISLLYLRKFQNIRLRELLIILPLVAIFTSYCWYHKEYLRISKTAEGFWQLQRNWLDIQRYAQAHTPKNALFLVPYDTEMGGFRILSERSIVCCYRDCGIVGFDYAAAVEWQNRIKDIEAFKVIIRERFDTALLKALLKYKVNYIVFMRYAEPQVSIPSLEKVYDNSVFSLYAVRMNPLRP